VESNPIIILIKPKRTSATTSIQNQRHITRAIRNSGFGAF
jgi:ribosomal protein S18